MSLCIELWMTSLKKACMALYHFKEEHPGLKVIQKATKVTLQH